MTERGDAGPLEVVILVPVVLLVFALVVAFSRTTTATEHVAHAAAVGARAAASAQTAGGATALATDVVADALAQVGMSCDPPARGRHVHAGRERHGDGVVHRRPRRPHVVRGDPRLADADGVGDGAHRPHEGWWVVSVRRRLRGERGSVSLLVVVMVPALLMAAGLVLDGGRQLQARREAAAAASSAARAAAQMSDQEAYGPGLDPALGRGTSAGAAAGTRPRRNGRRSRRPR